MKKNFHAFSCLFAKAFAKQFSNGIIPARLGLALCVALFTASAAFARTIDLLTEVPSEYGIIQVSDGDVLTGMLNGSKRPYKVSIAEGATVTLNGVEINGDNDIRYQWAGITCEGDCNIVLAEGRENTVNGFYQSSGIYIPEGNTLTIRGSGKLVANSGLNSNGQGYSAGIGGGYYVPCGNIVIEGGEINAVGGSAGGAGIGGGEYASCGNITIMGGNIEAKGTSASGIGGSYYGSCGNITIMGGNIEAKGTSASGIGSFYGGSCGKISISGGTVTATGWNGAGVGSGAYSSCGDISISGGSVSATSNGGGAGIGSGVGGSCGQISISGGAVTAQGANRSAGIGGSVNSSCEGIVIADEVEFVTAIKGKDAPYSIGRGYGDESTVGEVLVGISKGNIAMNSVTFTGGAYTVVFDKNDGSGIVKEQFFNIGIERALEENVFVREGGTFLGWSTNADGSGDFYQNGENVLNIAEVDGSIRLYAQWVFGNVVNLAGLKENYTAQDGDVLVGKLSHTYEISIANEATVVLGNVTIENVDGTNDEWPGITCNGNCNIVLKGENVVRGIGSYSPGIYIPSGNTLTIDGEGSLDVRSDHAAAIGGGFNMDVGNIVIKGGNITAVGGKSSAAIGLGSGALYCGSITISGEKTIVKAEAGEGAPYSIGMGLSGEGIGTITIGGFESGSISASPFKYPLRKTYTVEFNANGGEGSMESQTLYLYVKQMLNANKFVNKGKLFAGWNTAPDGKGVNYSDCVKVMDLAEENGKVTLYAQWFDGSLADLNGDYVAHDGEVLTGTLGGNYRLSIADGASVTLNNVTIKNIETINYVNSYGYDWWAGITCLGDCRIVLAEGSVNTVKGFNAYSPGIYVPEGKTLTIEGSGALDASNGVDAEGRGYSAGIGCGIGLNCGNIEIKGGDVTATGGEEAAGIGGAYDASCGDITITDGVTKVTATKGGGAQYSIGLGHLFETSAGVITINNVVTNGVPISPFVFDGELSTYMVVFDANGGHESMESQTLYVGLEQVLNANSYTYEGKMFAGWNTDPKGGGTSYSNRAAVHDLAAADGSVTLYAQWFDGDISVLTGDFVAPTGSVLTGTLGGNYKISIADGATVTLNNVNIPGAELSEEDMEDYEKLLSLGDGIRCEGDCEIILADNSVNNVVGYFSGIFVPEGKTLTIKGNGSLVAKSNGIGAGIGGRYNTSSGDIVIKGGYVSAFGADYGGAGIGCGFVMDETITCGNINIIGGSVSAVGGCGAAGIGLGIAEFGNVYGGSITIAERGVNVTAKRGECDFDDELGPHSIGLGYGYNATNTIGTITIGQTVTGPIETDPFVYPEEPLLVITEDENGKHATVNGAYGGVDAFMIDNAIEVNDIVFDRKFAAIDGENRYSTIMLPFSIEGSRLTGVKRVYKFSGVASCTDENGILTKCVEMYYQWCPPNECVNSVTGQNLVFDGKGIDAYTPYLIQLEDGATSIGFNGAVTLEKTPTGEEAFDVVGDGSGDYVLRGVLQYKTWQATDPEITNERGAAAYGYVASDVKDVASAGDFVMVGAGSYISPFRAYIYKKPSPQLAAAQGAYVLRHDASVGSETPDRMNVIIVDKDENGNEQTTVIGQFNTRTGEFRWSRPKRMFDAKGRNVGHRVNKARGAYYGKKILK